MSEFLYVLVTLILFVLNMIGNLVAMSMNKTNSFPVATFLATMMAMFFVIWGFSILIQ
jgi:hypothetical protein